MKKFLSLLIVHCSLFIAAASAMPNMTAEISMDARANTAAAAKREANESAVRAAVMQVLARYSDRAAVENIVMGADEGALQNMVAATSISNEKTSKTAYGAKFSITLDRAAVEKWYADNNVMNFLTAADDSNERVVVSMEFSNGISDWTELNRIMREGGDAYGLTMRTIFRTSATAYIPTNKKRKFQMLCSSNGWSVTSRDGVLKIAK